MTLEEENARLRMALEVIADLSADFSQSGMFVQYYQEPFRVARAVARAALNGGDAGASSVSHREVGQA